MLLVIMSFSEINEVLLVSISYFLYSWGKIKLPDDWIQTAEATALPTEPQPLPQRSFVFPTIY